MTFFYYFIYFFHVDECLIFIQLFSFNVNVLVFLSVLLYCNGKCIVSGT